MKITKQFMAVAAAAVVACMAAACGAEKQSEAAQDQADKTEEQAEATTEGKLEKATSDKFKVYKAQTLLRTADQVSDSAAAVYKDGEPQPYNYQRFRVVLYMPTQMAGESEAYVNDVLVPQLLEAGFGERKRDTIDQTIAAFTRQDVRSADNPNAKYVIEPDTADFLGYGVTESTVAIYPALTSNIYLQFAVVKVFDSGSGMGAGISVNEHYVTIARQYQSWLSGDLEVRPTFIFGSGAPTPDILPLINDEMAQARSRGEGCLWDEGAARVPGNVRIVANGLGFIFDKYEVACGADGNYMAVVPWDKISPFLAPRFNEWIAGARDVKTMPAPDIWE